MKNILFIVIIALVSCNSKKEKDIKEQQPAKPLSKWVEILKDTAGNSSGMFVIDTAHFDTANINSSPIRILSKETGTQKNYVGVEEKTIRISYQNISSKTIEAIKLRWYCEDAFGEPALLYNDREFTIGDGRNNDQLKPGTSGTIEWEGMSVDLHKVISAWAYEVAFSDGTTWKASGK